MLCLPSLMFEYKLMHDGHPNCWEPYNMVSTGELSTPGLTQVPHAYYCVEIERIIVIQSLPVENI